MSLFGLTPGQVRQSIRMQDRQNAQQFGGFGALGNFISTKAGLKGSGGAEAERAARVHGIKNRIVAMPEFKSMDNMQKLQTLAKGMMDAGEVEVAMGIMEQGKQMIQKEGQARKPIQTTTGWIDPNTGKYMRDPEGKVLMPISASPTLKREMMRASGEGQGISKVVTSAYEGIDNITQNIADLKEARRLVVEEGADTGPLVSKMPTLRSASRKLKTIQSKLGLNVVGSVTFGALSKGELDLALSTALPTELDGPELVDWIDRKIVAQEKLSENLGLAADYLSVPGNTRAGWRKEVKKMKKGPPKGIDPEDWKYMTPEEKALW